MPRANDKLDDRLGSLYEGGRGSSRRSGLAGKEGDAAAGPFGGSSHRGGLCSKIASDVGDPLDEDERGALGNGARERRSWDCEEGDADGPNDEAAPVDPLHRELWLGGPSAPKWGERPQAFNEEAWRRMPSELRLLWAVALTAHQDNDTVWLAEYAGLLKKYFLVEV